jgi:hypothetical protein
MGGGGVQPVSIFSREKNEIIYPYFDQILMDLRKILENYRHLCKKVVIFRKNETALKVCWLGVEKLVFFGYLEGGGWGVKAISIFTMETGISNCQSDYILKICAPS